MGLTSEGRRYNPPHMLPAASPLAVEINGQRSQAYLSPQLQRPPVAPGESKSALHTLLLTAALIFAAATVVYSCVWMYYVRTNSFVNRESSSALIITHVSKHNGGRESGFTTTPWAVTSKVGFVRMATPTCSDTK